MEEDDSLQDLWVNLLITAGDPDGQSRVHVAFVDLIGQLEPIEARLLQCIYELAYRESEKHGKGVPEHAPSAEYWPIHTSQVTEQLGINNQVLNISLDNLMRQRCIASSVGEEEVVTSPNVFGTTTHATVTRDYGYEEVVVTAFGCAFVEACMADTSQETE
jgi:hypothetical protein